jgi:hypothetical protein
MSTPASADDGWPGAVRDTAAAHEKSDKPDTAAAEALVPPPVLLHPMQAYVPSLLTCSRGGILACV